MFYTLKSEKLGLQMLYFAHMQGYDNSSLLKKKTSQAYTMLAQTLV